MWVQVTLSIDEYLRSALQAWNNDFPLGRQWCHKKTKKLMENLVNRSVPVVQLWCGHILDLFAAACADGLSCRNQADAWSVWLHRTLNHSIASAVYQKYRTQAGDAKVVITCLYSGIHLQIPYCDGRSGGRWTGLGDFEALAKLHTLGVPAPPAVDGLETAPVRHRTSAAAKDMQQPWRLLGTQFSVLSKSVWLFSYPISIHTKKS